MSNIIRIKRRLPDSILGTALPLLSGGELAFNEINTTLYYGASSTSGTTAIAIGGAGTFATNTLVNTLTSDLQSQIDNVNSGTDNLSSHVDTYFVEKTEFDAVTLNGGLTVSAGFISDTIYASGNASIGGDLTITGSLSVLGTQVIVNTETINISGTSTQIDVINNGTGTGITVNQIGNQDVAEFKDDGATAFIIKDGGNIGIGTATPNEKLTVTGNISATGNIYASGQFEVNGGGTNITLWVEDSKVGINTETPNEALTVVGSISATEDIYARNGTLTGTLDVTSGATFASTLSVVGTVDFDSTLDVVGATTLQSTLDVTSGATFASTVSAAGAVDFDSTLDVVGATTLQSTLDVTSAATFASSVSAAGALTVDGTTTLNDDLTVTDLITVNSSSNANNITIDGTNHMISIFDAVNAGFPTTDYKLTGITAFKNGFTIDTDDDGGAGINFTPFAGSHTSVTQGNLNVLTGDLSGNGSNFIQDFIIDGGSF